MHRCHSTRHVRFHAIVLSALALILCPCLSAVAQRSPGAEPGSVTELSEHLLVYHGPINVGIVRDGNRALLVDCGDASAAAALKKLGITKIEQIVFTHHHRDQACGARQLAPGAKIGVPAGERELFANTASYWSDDGQLWRVYRSFRPHPLTLTEPLEVDEAFADGHQLEFGPAKIRVLDTPGHTEGSVSYLVEVDGKRVVFSGDAIYDEGRVWDVYTLQKGFSKGGRSIGGYHGFMGDRWRLVESLERIKELKPDLLLPSHGNLMRQPARAVDTLIERFETCYENYVAISALRHYFPPLFTDYEGKPGQMPIRPGIKPPDCLRHFGTTWMLVSKTGAAFVMDVGSPRIVDQLQKMLTDGEIKSVDGLWVTHYHYDHTDGIPEFQQVFDCPCITDRRLADVLTNPTAWRLPCLAPEPIRVHRPMEDGQSWPWHEFKLTSYFYPGQTRYHDALLAEAGDLRMLFVGDSHTMSGIDDYCAYNRNWLGRDVGFQYCISLIEKLRPTHIFNCHVADAFTFTPEEIGFMRKNLDEREELFGELVPWDHANYGLDACWVRAFPYTQQAKPGDTVQVDVVITNHSTQAHNCACRAVLPEALGGEPGAWLQGTAPAKTEHALPLSLPIPADTPPGRYVIPIDVKHGPWHLPQFAEAIIDVGA
jgi:glyoxylase-like metal-dependent hydrolase (beta-lactamase superfamily II)